MGKKAALSNFECVIVIVARLSECFRDSLVFTENGLKMSSEQQFSRLFLWVKNPC